MFLQYAPPGALVPLFSIRLEKDLHFSRGELGVAAGMGALAAMIAPLVAGQVADRWIPAERCLTVLAFVAGALAWVLAELTSPAAVIGMALVFWLVMIPVWTLGTSITFTHLANPDLRFGGVRMWGTVGWMMPGWLLGYWFSNPGWLTSLLQVMGIQAPRIGHADAFRLAGLLAWAVGLYGLTLPHTPPQRRAGAALAPLAALRLLRGRSFAVFAVCTFGLCVTIPYSTQATPLLLVHLGIPPPWLPPALTLAQSLEVVCLALLPMFLLRFGLRGTMVVGLAAWALAMGVLAWGEPLGLVVASLGLHGVTICCFLVAGQVFVNRRARGDVRVSVQALLTCISGSGLLMGNLSVIAVRNLAGGDFSQTFAVPALLTAALLALFLAGFREDEPAKERGLPPDAERQAR